MNEDKNNIPAAYFITFRTYATWLHGDARLSVDPKHNTYATPRIPENIALHRAMQKKCIEDSFIINAQYRETVLRSIIDTSEYNHWHLYAAHVRSNHAHMVIRSDLSKEITRTKIKIYATKYLKKYHADIAKRKNFWSEGGSDKIIWKEGDVFPTMYYVIEQQGEKMAVYYDKIYDEVDWSSYCIF